MKWIRLWVDEFLEGTTFAELNMEERGVWLCFLALAGRGRRPGIVEMREGVSWPMPALAAYLQCSEELLNQTLQKLLKHTKVVCENDGSISIKNWDKYQTTYEKRKTLHRDTTGDREVEGEVEEDITPYSPSFVKFWLAYPKKENKAAAYAAWKKLNPDGALYLKILSAVGTQKHKPQWNAEAGKYIPLPSTWLNQRRWEDEIVEDKIEYPSYKQDRDPIPELRGAINKGWK